MMLQISHSKQLSHFKRLIGHTNHYLITILIGIEGVRIGKVTKGETFNVSWEPESLEETVKRSRIFARNAALSWTIDSLDAYLGFLRKHPFNFPQNFSAEIANDRSVFNMLNKVIDFTKYPIDLPLSIVHLGIQWRNNIVHYHAHNELEEKYASFLRNVKRESIQERFRGLDPSLMLENFKDNKPPAFKEVAAIIQSTHYLVLELDKLLKDYIDVVFFVKQIINENELDIDNIVFSHPNKKLAKMKQYFITKGFTEVIDVNAKATIDDKEIEVIIASEYKKRKAIRNEKKEL